MTCTGIAKTSRIGAGFCGRTVGMTFRQNLGDKFSFVVLKGVKGKVEYDSHAVFDALYIRR